MALYRKRIGVLVSFGALGFILYLFYFSSLVYPDLAAPHLLKTAVSGTRVDKPARNSQFLCIPGVPSSLKIEQSRNLWLNDFDLIVSRYMSVAVSGKVLNDVSIFNTTLTEKTPFCRQWYSQPRNWYISRSARDTSLPLLRFCACSRVSKRSRNSYQTL